MDVTVARLGLVIRYSAMQGRLVVLIAEASEEDILVTIDGHWLSGWNAY